MKSRILHNADDVRHLAQSVRTWEQYIPLRVTVEQYRPRRSVDQNAKLHAMCADIARQREWAGQRLDTEDWKRLLVDAYLREVTGHGGRVVPSLDGSGIVSLGMQTRRMSGQQMSELIDWILAWGTEQGVEWSDDAE